MNINKITEIGIEEPVFERQEIINFLLIVEQIMNQVNIDRQILDALDNVIVIIMRFIQSDSNEILVHNLFSKMKVYQKQITALNQSFHRENRKRNNRYQ